MPRLCTICTHPQRRQIDAALLQHAEGYRNIGKRFGVGYQAVYQHAQTHLRQTFQQSKELAMSLSADSLLTEVSTWHERMEAQYAKADKADNVFAAVATARTGIAAIEAFARIGRRPYE